MQLIGLMNNLIATAATSKPDRGFWMPESASTVAPEIDFVFDFITWLSIFFFVAIVGLTAFLAWKYRRIEGKDPGRAPIHNTPIELVWTIIPLLLVIAIFYVGLQGMLKLRNAPVGAYEVQVTAQKWSWTFTHPNGVTTDRLHVPRDTPVKLVMKSQDVLHSLYIPAFRVKQDIVPGRYTEIWFEATNDGIYDLFCTEFCGQQHSQMVTVCEVLERENFDDKMVELAAIFDRAPDEAKPYLAAERLYGRCKSCHTIDGSRLTGPSFQETHQMYAAGQSRRLVDGSEVAVDANYLRLAILNPKYHIVDTYQPVMPMFSSQLKESEVDALVMMLMNLDTVFTDGAATDMPPDIRKANEEAQAGEDSGEGA